MLYLGVTAGTMGLVPADLKGQEGRRMFMLTSLLRTAATMSLLLTMGQRGEPAPEPAETLAESAPSIYDFTVKDIDGKDVKLAKYKGNVLMIVNVASQ